MKRDIALASGNTLKTLAVLRVTRETARFAAQTLARIATGGVSCAGVIVAGEGEMDRDALLAAAGDVPVSFSPDTDGLAAARAGVRDGGASGVFLIAAGMHLPDAFDVRLARIAMQDPLVGTVSPLCDLSAIHRLREVPIAAGVAAAEIDRLDRLAFLLGRKTYFEVPDCLPECCFVSAGAIERGLAAEGLFHVLSDSVYVGKLASAEIALRLASPRAEPPQLARVRKAILDAFHAGVIFSGAPGLDPRPVQLHVMHSLGGGSEKWLRDFGLADSSRANLVLKSVTHGEAMGSGLALYTHVLDEIPLKVWRFATPIAATVEAHLEYRGVLNEIIAEHCVDAVVVSSLIGHSLDALDTGLPTVVVTHDYFPYCPAINIHFGGVCRTCDAQRIEECHRENKRFNPFTTFMPRERISVREKYMRLIRRPEVRMVTPSRSVAQNLERLNPLFTQVASTTIAHGYGDPLSRRPTPELPPEARLRILVLGQLSVLKGVEMLRSAIREITAFAEVYLIGPREMGEAFRFEPHVHVLDRYDVAELPVHVANVNPHLGLLMSIGPETFSYALTELHMLGIPVAATRVGSFAERIQPGENGYLFEADAQSLVAMLKGVDSDRATLARIRANLQGFAPRTAVEMVADYHRIIPIEDMPYARYPLQRPSPETESPHRDEALVSQAVTLAGMWKEVKSLHLSLSVVNEARQGEQRHFQDTTREHEKQAAEAREHARMRAEEIQGLQKLAKDHAARIQERDGQLQVLSSHLDFKNAKLAEVYASTSWKLSAPIRLVGTLVRDLRTLARCLAPALRDPRLLPEYAVRSVRAIRTGGVAELKRELVGLQAYGGYRDAWHQYRSTFRTQVRPRIVRAIREMGTQPLISIIVPTYNTPEKMLREMLESVRAQLYPRWELCIADDGSTEPQVARILAEYAAKDRRIKIDVGRANAGVSHASNRALAMATGEFTVLLDHDDLLEEQALFRVAESVAAESPDMVYSDEVRVSPDGAAIRELVYRPAFSPEFLRGHPYIVHLVAFRTQLLRDVGGWDERLRISQDYDLILRVAEKARKVVHIPEILYQWRVHPSSAGHQKMHEVMQTSSALLQRHLERSGEPGNVSEGVGFNLFDARYALRDGLRVAIVIPTKNHGVLLRQCIESLRATVQNVAYDVIVVDHESDDRETLDYLASAEGVKVLRYAGKFNFSAINNWAVARLEGDYSHYLFCNNDIEAMKPGWLERMLELGQRESIGIVGAKLLYTDAKTIQHAGVCVGAFGVAEHYGKFLRLPDDRIEPGYMGALVLNHEVSAVTAACMLIRRDAFEEVSGFDAALAVGFGDVDLCLRVAERGYRVVFCPHAVLMHHESYTRGSTPHPEDTALYQFRWKALIAAGDPYYNPGMSLTRTDWAVNQPLHCAYEVRRRIFTRGVNGREAMSFSQLSAPAAAPA